MCCLPRSSLSSKDKAEFNNYEALPFRETGILFEILFLPHARVQVVQREQREEEERRGSRELVERDSKCARDKE